MFRPARLTAAFALSCLMLSPALPVYDLTNGGAAFAGEKGNGGNGGGKSEKAGKSDRGEKAAAKGSGKSKPAKPATAVKSKTKQPPTNGTTATKTKAADPAEGMHPSELGKMNGALNANINAILAHIRNGQTANGPVGLMAGLAVADAAAAESLETLRDLEDLADAHAALDGGLTEAGYASLADYLAAHSAGTVTPEDQQLIDSLVADAGGLTEDGTDLATPAPTDEVLAAAYAEAGAGAAGVTEAEEAFVAAWNKEGDPEELLDMARDRLAEYSDEIASTISETEAENGDPSELPDGEDAADVGETTGDDLILILEPESEAG